MCSLLEKAERIWETRKSMRAMFPNEPWPNLVKESVFRGKDRVRIDDQFSLTDQNTGETFSFVSPDYEILLHEEVAATAVSAAKAMESEYGPAKIKHQFLQNGAKYIVQVQFDQQVKPVVVGDVVSPFINIKNSYDKTWARNIMYGATELVCTNGLVRPVVKGKNKQRHITGSTVGQVEEIIQEYLSVEFPSIMATWQAWAGTKVEKELAEEIFAKLPFSENELEKMMSIPLIGSKDTINKMIEGNTATLWDINRIATQYLTHEVKSPLRTLQDTEIVSRVLSKYEL